VLGVGTLWVGNGVYATNTFRSIGTHGLAAYQAEFHQAIAVIPVENAGNPGRPNAHWDQLMRSSSQEGNPSDPCSLDPRVGVVDQDGHDRGLERMTGAIDPDYGEPFLSRFTVESMRDLGYTVARFEDFDGDGAVDLRDDQATSYMAGCSPVMPTTSSSKIFTARDCPCPVAGRSLRASCPSLTPMPPVLRHPGCAWRHTPARGARTAPRCSSVRIPSSTRRMHAGDAESGSFFFCLFSSSADFPPRR
jgi:hypothetical protein